MNHKASTWRRWAIAAGIVCIALSITIMVRASRGTSGWVDLLPFDPWCGASLMSDRTWFGLGVGWSVLGAIELAAVAVSIATANWFQVSWQGLVAIGFVGGAVAIFG